MRAIKLTVFLGLLQILLVPAVFGSGMSFDGIGAKARAMGGAFRAVADDWTAAYYNPAGYGRIQDNVIAADAAILHNRYSLTPNVLWGGEYESGFFNGQEIANKHEVLNVPQGGILARLPAPGLGEMVFGFSIIQQFDQNQTWQLFQNIPTHSDSTFPLNQFGINFDAVAFQFTAAKNYIEDRLSLGLGLSLVRGDLKYSSIALRNNPMPSPVSDRPHDKIPEWYETDGYGWGFGYRFGALFDATEKLHLGLVYTGKTSLDIDGTTRLKFYMGDNPYNDYYETNQLFEELLFLNGEVINATADFKTTIDLPASIGGGLAYDVNDRLTVALDAEYIFWSQFEGFNFEFTDFQGNTFRDETILTDTTFTRAQDMMTGDLAIPVVWKDAPRVMVGATYQALSYLNVRAGFMADKSAIDWENVDGITLTPQFFDLGTKYTYSLGLGFDIDVWNISLTNSYTHYPDLNVYQQADVDDDGLMDNLTGGYEGDQYQTVLGISYRF